MIVVFGSINIDLVFRAPKLPKPGETVLGPSYQIAAGGKGLNQAVASARAAGGSPVHMAGRVGRDGFAQIAEAELRDAGVDTRHFETSDVPTGCAAICVDDTGENQIMVASGANLESHADQVPDDLLGPDTTLVMQMEVRPEQNWALIARASARGARTVLNLAPAAEVPSGTIEALDIIVLNEIEAGMLAESANIAADKPEVIARTLAERFGTTAVVSLGSEGALAASPTEAWRVGTLAITPVDTVGAGDAFVGALCAAFDAGQALPEALRFSSVAGGLACLKEGAAPAMPTKQEIDSRTADLPPPRPM